MPLSSKEIPPADCLLIPDPELSAPELMERVRKNMTCRRELPPMPAAVGMVQLAEKRDVLARSIRSLERRIRNYGTVGSRKAGWRGRIELFVKKALRKLVLRHVLQQRRVHVRLLTILGQLGQYLEEQDRFLRTALDLADREYSMLPGDPAETVPDPGSSRIAS
jgi:hypothetical protein